MSELSVLEKQLIDSFDDLKLSDSERAELKELARPLSADKVRFIRNKAFAIARDKIATASGDDNAAEALSALGWLERVVKTLDQATRKQAITSGAYFSPGTACMKKIVDLCHQAKRNIDICVFTISDDRLSAAIKKAHDRGVQVRIITDNDKANDSGSDVDQLARQGVPLRMDRTEYHMHHKFALFDRVTLLNGSFNWTRSATDKNEENILVTDSETLCASYLEQFERLWQKFA
ncbi:nuclease [Corallincola holothuriorum]|uniref:phospholipase D n=1 Tax=Corallincola holothuriorum TaxID=2282215 RepID=A0A368NID8_9GAMM|nr:phospholipase D-like domain-containing protein [Corallincola holothuriorum]RCU49505.1 nuclease [Corallincola holothuriorum]